MRPDLTPIQKRRQSLLTVVLTFMGAAFLLFVMVLLTGGLFLYVIGVGAFIAFLCAFHYLVWGKMLSEEVAGEREEEQLRRLAASEEWPRVNGQPYQR